MVYGMVCRAWRGIAWRAWQDISYGLAGMTWYMVLPGEVWDGIWCDMAG